MIREINCFVGEVLSLVFFIEESLNYLKLDIMLVDKLESVKLYIVVQVLRFIVIVVDVVCLFILFSEFDLESESGVWIL